MPHTFLVVASRALRATQKQPGDGGQSRPSTLVICSD
jgi:hypothetical protein